MFQFKYAGDCRSLLWLDAHANLESCHGIANFEGQSPLLHLHFLLNKFD